jgi:pSer/pThr/pTyr-binding forkhead associated (FHA) protein
LSSYYFRQFECEICKTSYPYIFKGKGKKYNLIDIPVIQNLSKPGQNPRQQTGDYLILESLTLEKNTSRMVHVLTPTQHVRSVRLGRGHDSDLRINDISVSRCHAVIRFRNDGFYLQDNMSKFGTLVLVRRRLPLSPAIT